MKPLIPRNLIGLPRGFRIRCWAWRSASGSWWKKDYEALLAEHTKLSEKIQVIAEQKKDKAERRQRIELFLHMMEEQKECTGFEPGTFVALVDKVVIQHDGHMEFRFRNGMKCAYPQ